MVLRYTGISGGEIRQLLDSTAKFPNSPDEQYYITELLTPLGAADTYGQLIIGFLVPDTTGWYRFSVASDDQGAFWLSTDVNPANLRPAGFTIGSSGTGNHNNAGHRMQQSRAIYLEAGQPYYFEGLHKEGTGGDGWRVGWVQLSGPTDPAQVANNAIVPGSVLRSAMNPGAVSFYQQPANVSAQEGQLVVVEALLDGDAPFTYQWKVNGVLTGPVTKTYSTRVFYAFNPLAAGEDGTTLSVVATNQAEASWAESATAMVTVVGDSTAPALVEAIGLTTAPNTLHVRFSEAVATTEAEDAGNYSFDNGAAVLSAVQNLADSARVTLTMDPGFPAVTHGTEMTIGVVQDDAGNTATSLTIPVILNQGTIRRQVYENRTGGNINDLLNDPNYPYYPSLVEFRTDFSTPRNDADPPRDYGTRLQGFIRVGKTGSYRIAISSDDQSKLFLSPDENPANMQFIMGVSHWQQNLNYNRTRMSQSIVELTAGVNHYVEVLHKENTGGDHVQVALEEWTPLITSDALPRNFDGPIVNGTLPLAGLYLNPYNEPVSIDPAYPEDVSVTGPCVPAVTLQTVLLAGSPQLTVQWYDDSTGLPIPDATDFTHTLNPPLTSGAYYCVVGNSVNSVTSRTAVVTAPSYTGGPELVAAATLDGLAIGVTFDRVLSTGQDNVNNYKILDPGTGTPLASVTAVTALETAPAPLGDLNVGGTRHMLTVDPPVTGDFLLTVESMQDCLGNDLNPAATNYLVQRWGVSMDIGLDLNTANQAATNFPINVGNVDVRVSGADIWGQADEFNFVYQPITGDFDIKVHTPRLDRPNAWAKSGIMARVDTTPGSRHVYVVTADFTTPGEARVAVGRRDTPDAVSAGWPSDPRPAIPRPLSWVRLRRAGDTFYAYYSTNGIYWTFLSSYTPSWDGPAPATLLVGLCTTSHARNANTTAEYRDYGNTSYPGSTLTLTEQPASVTTKQGTKVRFAFSVEVDNAPPDELVYQWQRGDGLGGFVDIPGANSTTLTTGFLTVAADNGSEYRAIAQIPGLSVTSQVAVVTVEADDIPPQLLYVACLNPTNLAVFFSEPMHADSADQFAWELSDGAGVQLGAINAANPTRIDLTLTDSAPLVPGNVYTLTAGTVFADVFDLAMNLLDPTPTTVEFVAVLDYYAGAIAGNTGGRTTEPDYITVLSTDTMLPMGSLALRGFDCRAVQITNILAGSNDNAEKVLAGTYEVGAWPFQEPQGPNFAENPTFIECNVINYALTAGSAYGHFTPDDPTPGIPSSLYPTGLTLGETNNFAFEGLAYLKLTQGLHRLGVTSDDGFRVSLVTEPGNPAGGLILGEYSIPRAANSTTFDVYVPADGLYPFRLLWWQAAGFASVEFWDYDLQTGAYSLINADTGIIAYRPSGVGVPGVEVAPFDLTITTDGVEVTICWPELPTIPDDSCNSIRGVLLGADDLTPPVVWTPVLAVPVTIGGMQCVTIPADQAARYYRLQVAQ